MKKNNKTKFLEGALIGLALGIAGSIFLSSKKGEKIKGDIKNITADFYKYIAPKVKKVKKMGEKEYKEFIKNSVKQYGKVKKISGDKISELTKEAIKSWNHLSK